MATNNRENEIVSGHLHYAKSGNTLPAHGRRGFLRDYAASNGAVFIEDSPSPALNRDLYYYSTSKQELVLIDDMNDQYLVNVIQKKMREYVAAMYSKSNRLSVDEVRGRISGQAAIEGDSEYKALVAEFVNRFGLD